MAFSSLTAEETASGRAIIQSLLRKIRDNFDFLNGTIGSLSSGDIQNGSFETDSDADGVPDGWTVATYPGGTCARDTASPYHGAAALKMVHPGGAGNGGGYADSDYAPCSEYATLALRLLLRSSASTMKNQIIIYWFTAAKVACATPSTTVYDSISNPTATTQVFCGATPPSTARFFKLRLVGGHSSVNVAGSVYFDGIEFLGGVTSRHPITASASATASATTFTDLCSVTLPTTIGIFCGNTVVTVHLYRTVSASSGGGTAVFRLKIGTEYSEESILVNPNNTSASDNLTEKIIVSSLSKGAVITLQAKKTGASDSYFGEIRANGITIQLQQ